MPIMMVLSMTQWRLAEELVWAKVRQQVEEEEVEVVVFQQLLVCHTTDLPHDSNQQQEEDIIGLPCREANQVFSIL